MYYVVVCRYYGCEEGDEGGYHVLMVTSDRKQAEIAAGEHRFNNPDTKSMHVGDFYTSVHERELDRQYTQEYQ